MIRKIFIIKIYYIVFIYTSFGIALGNTTNSFPEPKIISNGWKRYYNLDHDGIRFATKDENGTKNECMVTVEIIPTDFLRELDDLVQGGIVDPLPEGTHPEKHKYSLMQQAAERIAPLLIKKIFSLNPEPNSCGFSFYYETVGYNYKKYYPLMLNIIFSRNAFDKINWDEIKYYQIQDASLVYYIPEEYSDQLIKEDQGFWKTP